MFTKPFQAMSQSSICFQLIEHLDLHKSSLCTKDECQGGSNTGFASAVGLGSRRHHKEMYVVVAWLLVKDAEYFLMLCPTKDMLRASTLCRET